MQTRISARPRRFHAHLFPTILVISLVPALSSGGLPARSPVANDGLRNQTANSQLNSEVVTAGISANQARNENPQVHPVNSRPYGLSYAEWSARWWQWIYQIPLSVKPNFDTTGEDCAQGQPGVERKRRWCPADEFDCLPRTIARIRVLRSQRQHSERSAWSHYTGRHPPARCL